MKKKGFTLIELLAVIIILAVIALIATPIVLNVVESVKKQAAIESINGIIDAAKMYSYEGMFSGETQKRFDFPGDDKLQYQGTKPEKGTILINDEGKISAVILINGYCVTKDYEDKGPKISEMELCEPSGSSNNNNNNNNTDNTNDQEVSSLNTIMAVGTKMYAQHDENNNNVYDLVKNGDETIVYEEIIVNFTAGKRWTSDGQYVDYTSTPAHSATSPENYLAVKSGDVYFTKLYGIGYDSGVWYTPILFLNDNNEVVGEALRNTVSQSKSGVEFTVPEGATRMHVTMYGNQSFTLQKKLTLTSSEFDEITKVINKENILSQIDSQYADLTEDPILYENLDKGYITFVNDDTTNYIGNFADLFISKNTPLCLATIPELLIENTITNTETRLEVARRVQANGGEILSHRGEVLTEANYTDYNSLFHQFIRSKQIFNYYNLDVNGVILAGGSGQIVGSSQTEKWASTFYKYSDLYGTEYTTSSYALDSVYNHQRIGLGNYSNNQEKLKEAVDSAIANKEWVIFYWHNTNEINMETLEFLIDYVNSKNSNELEVVTYRDMYENFAQRESELKKKLSQLQ